jgi:hypothetical protein
MGFVHEYHADALKVLSLMDEAIVQAAILFGILDPSDSDSDLANAFRSGTAWQHSRALVDCLIQSAEAGGYDAVLIPDYHGLDTDQYGHALVVTATHKLRHIHAHQPELQLI